VALAVVVGRLVGAREPEHQKRVHAATQPPEAQGAPKTYSKRTAGLAGPTTGCRELGDCPANKAVLGAGGRKHLEVRVVSLHSHDRPTLGADAELRTLRRRAVFRSSRPTGIMPIATSHRVLVTWQSEDSRRPSRVTLVAASLAAAKTVSLAPGNLARVPIRRTRVQRSLAMSPPNLR